MSHASYSQLKLFLQHPYQKAGWLLDNRGDFVQTAAMRFGSMVDSLYYEQQDGGFVAWPKDADGKELNANSNAYKAAKADLRPGAEFIKAEEFGEAEECVKALVEHDLAAQYRAGGICQKKLIFNYAGTDIHCVPDCVNFMGISDLKTTTDASPRAFSKLIWDMKYHLQAYLYRQAIFQETGVVSDFFWIVAESKAPHHIEVFKASPELLEQGAKDTATAMVLWREWKAGNVDKYKATEPLTIDLPMYAYDRED